MPTISKSEALAEAAALDSGHITYPGDEALPAPVPYYSPDRLNVHFKVYADPERQRFYRPEQFKNGRYIAYTRLQEAAVRRALGPQAEQFRGDDAPRELKCHNPACRFRTRNTAAFERHQEIEKLKADIHVPTAF